MQAFHPAHPLISELKVFFETTGFQLHCILIRNSFYHFLDKHIHSIKIQHSPDLLLIINTKNKSIDLHYHSKTSSHFTSQECEKALKNMKLFFQSTHTDHALQLSIKALQRLFQ